MVDASFVASGIITAGTVLPATQSIFTKLGPSRVRRISIIFPAGCGGLVGVRIRASGGFAFPNVDGQYFSFDDYVYTFDVANQTDAGQWQAECYNVDLTDHGITVIYEYDYLRGSQTLSQSQPIAI